MLFAVNILLIPKYGYWACAWGGVAGYGTAMVLSYIVGQKKNPIPYPMQSIAYYVALTVMLTMSIYYIPETYGFGPILTLAFNTLCICCFVSYIIHNDLPVSCLPIIGKKFKK